MKNNLIKLICAAAVGSLGFTAMAATIFDNTTAYNGSQFLLADGQQVGNEVTLGANWYLTNFQFEYYSPNLTLNASLGVDVRFYLNNGTPAGGYPTPGTLIYDSGWFYNTFGGIPGGAAYDLNYTSSDLYSGGLYNLNTTLPGNLLPGDFTYTITFTNLGTDTIELPLANDSVGTNYGTYWLYNNLSSQWSLLTNSVPANTLTIFQGTPTPEPSVFGLGAIGSLLLFGASKLKRRG